MVSKVKQKLNHWPSGKSRHKSYPEQKNLIAMNLTACRYEGLRMTDDFLLGKVSLGILS